MKRTLAVTGFTMLGTLSVFCNINNENAMLAAFSAACVALIFSLIIPKVRKNKTLPTVFLFVIISLIALNLSNKSYNKLITDFSQKEVTVSGCLISPAYKKGGKSYYVIKTDTVNSEKMHINIRLVTSSPVDFEPTDKITANVKLFTLGRDNDIYLKHYKSSALSLGAYPCGALEIQKSANHGLGQLILKLRVKMSGEIMKLLPNDYGAVITGIVLGDKSSLSIRTKNDFRFCGVSHLFAVSGLHISVWSLAFFNAIKKLRLSYKKCSVLTILFCIFFMALTGFNPPVIRSGFMMIMMFAAELFKREADAFNSIGFSLTVMLMSNPYNAINVSLLLSVLATSGILILHPIIFNVLTTKFKNIKNGKLKTLMFSTISIISVSISVTVFTMPIYIFVFGAISSLQIISNLLMISLGTLCMELAGVGALLCASGAVVLGKPLVVFAGVLSKIITETAHFLSSFRYAMFPLNTELSLLITVVFAVVGLIFYLLKYKNKRVISILCIFCAVVFSSVNIFSFLYEFNRLKLSVANAEGAVEIVASYKGKNIIFTNGSDYFSENVICGIIDKYGINTIDYLCLLSKSAEYDSLLFGYNVNSVFAADISRFDNLTSTAQLYEINKNTIELDSVKIGLDKSYAQLSFGETKILISFSDTPEFKNSECDIYIFKNISTDKIKYDFAVSCGNKFKALKDRNIYRVSENGSVSLLVNEDKTFKYWSVY